MTRFKGFQAKLYPNKSQVEILSQNLAACRKGRLRLQNIVIENNKIQLPEVGWMRCRGIREELLSKGKIRTVVVFKEAGSFYVSVSVLVKSLQKAEAPVLSKISERKTVGIAFGTIGTDVFIADSDGRIHKNQDFSKEIEKLMRIQKRLSQKQKGSKNWEFEKLRLEKVHQKIARKQNDYVHKLSKFYADNYDLVFIEDLNLRD